MAIIKSMLTNHDPWSASSGRSAREMVPKPETKPIETETKPTVIAPNTSWKENEPLFEHILIDIKNHLIFERQYYDYKLNGKYLAVAVETRIFDGFYIYTATRLQ